MKCLHALPKKFLKKFLSYLAKGLLKKFAEGVRSASRLLTDMGSQSCLDIIVKVTAHGESQIN